MTIARDQHGLLTGDLQYDVGFPVTVRSHITPVFYPCTICGTLTLHLAVEQPTGLAIKIPFMSKPLASTHKEYDLICNDCTVTAGLGGKSIQDKLEQRIVPIQICRTLDKFLESVHDAPLAYSEGFAKFALPYFDGDINFIASCLCVYRREA